MNGNHDDSNDVPPAKEPAPTPLVSAEELELSDYPLIHIPENRVYALGEVARKLAEQWSGTVKNFEKGLLGESGVKNSLGIKQVINTEVYSDGFDGAIDLNYRGTIIDVVRTLKIEDQVFRIEVVQ